MQRKRQAFPVKSNFDFTPELKLDIDAKAYLKDVAKELHKPIKHKFPTRSVIVDRKDQTWSMDLADMSTWKNDNDVDFDETKVTRVKADNFFNAFKLPLPSGP